VRRDRSNSVLVSEVSRTSHSNSNPNKTDSFPSFRTRELRTHTETQTQTKLNAPAHRLTLKHFDEQGLENVEAKAVY
jgi:hypothetical protein